MEEKQTVEPHENTPHTLEELKHITTIDTVHQDEAIKVLAQYAGDETWTPAEEKKLVRRVDRRLLSLLIVTYGLQYYDKAMLSQAVCLGKTNPPPLLTNVDRHSSDCVQT